jgi:hypothetical protein
LVPDEDGTFRLQVRENAGGRFKPTSAWPATKLVTSCGRLAGFSRYDELPADCQLINLSFLMSPMLWLIWIDAAQLSMLDVRHQEK